MTMWFICRKDIIDSTNIFALDIMLQYNKWRQTSDWQPDTSSNDL